MSALLHLSTVKVVGILFIVIGYALRFYVNKRRFNRRGVGGLQQFSSYESSVFTGTFEKILKFIGLIILLAGILFVFADWYNYKTAEKFREEKQREKIEKR